TSGPPRRGGHRRTVSFPAEFSSPRHSNCFLFKFMKVLSASIWVFFWFAAAAFGQAGAVKATVDQYCIGCHNDKLKSGAFSWTSVDLAHPDKTAERTERAIHMLRAGMMPPPGARRPDGAALKSLSTYL